MNKRKRKKGRYFERHAMSYATKEDINRVFDKVENVQNDVSDLKSTFTELKTTFDLTPKIKQPCKWLNDHLGTHKHTATTVVDYIIKKAIDIAALAIIGLIMFYFANAKLNQSQPEKEQSPSVQVLPRNQRQDPAASERLEGRPVSLSIDMHKNHSFDRR